MDECLECLTNICIMSPSNSNAKNNAFRDAHNTESDSNDANIVVGDTYLPSSDWTVDISWMMAMILNSS